MGLGTILAGIYLGTCAYGGKLAYTAFDSIVKHTMRIRVTES